MAVGASVLEVLIVGDSSKLTSALSQGTASAKGFESSVAKTGTAAKSSLGSIVPLAATAAAAGVAVFAAKSVDSAIQFDHAFTQIAALTNTTAGEIDGMKQAVLSLAAETAQSPVELAQAMYFLASAGLNASQQMETLEASAKASAVGLGEAGDIARITANALNVFADNGLKAADVTDTLAAAVREGSAEPDEFADALGRVLPIADKAGISFQQVAASLSTMSNAGLDVNEGVTALRGTLQALVAPTKQTSDALESIGLTVDDVVGSLQKDGLIATLRMLDQEARNNTDSAGAYNIMMRNLVPNVRALTGVFNLTGQEARKVDAIFKEVTNSSGDLEAAFTTTQEAASFKLQKALNELSIEGQKLASDVLPTLASGLGIVAEHAKGLFQILLAFGALKFGQKLAQQFGLSAASLGRFSSTAEAAGQNMAGLSLVVAAGVAAFTVAKGAWDDARIDLKQLASQTKISANLLGFWRDRMDLAGSVGEGHSFSGFIASLDGIGDNLNAVIEATQPLVAQMSELGLSADETINILGRFSAGLDGSAESINGLVTDTASAIAIIQSEADQFARGEESLHEFTRALGVYGISSETAFAIASAAADSHGNTLRKTGQAVRNFAGLTDEELTKLREDYRASFDVIGGVLDQFAGKAHLTAAKVIEAFRKQLNSIRTYQKNLETLKSRNIPDAILQQIADMGIEGAGFVKLLATANEQQFDKIINQMQAGATAADDVSAAITAIPKTHNTRVNVDTAAASNNVSQLASQLERLDGTAFDAFVNVHTQARSPWPDEALKMHLTDPMTKMGFRRIAGRWTLPIDVGIHTGHIDAARRMVEGTAASPPKWYAAASAPIKVPYTGDPPHRSRRRKITLDRRRFSDELAVDVDYRGW